MTTVALLLHRILALLWRLVPRQLEVPVVVTLFFAALIGAAWWSWFVYSHIFGAL